MQHSSPVDGLSCGPCDKKKVHLEHGGRISIGKWAPCGRSDLPRHSRSGPHVIRQHWIACRAPPTTPPAGHAPRRIAASAPVLAGRRLLHSHQLRQPVFLPRCIIVGWWWCRPWFPSIRACGRQPEPRRLPAFPNSYSNHHRPQ
jgi:hypothetical protein